MNISAYSYVPPSSVSDYGSLGRSPQQTSLDAYLSNQNPYKNPTTGLANNLGDLSNGVNWLSNQTARYNNQPFNSGAAGVWSPGGGSPSATMTNSSMNSAAINNNPLFNLVKVSKDPTGAYDATNRNYLDTINSSNPNYSSAQSSISSLSGATANQNLPGVQQANTGSTQNLIDKFNALSPHMDAATTAQTGALDKIYAPSTDPSSLAATYARNTNLASSAATQAATRAAQQALFAGRLANRNGGGSSYADAQLADTTGRIGEQVATANAERVRQDTANLLAAQTGNIGRSQGLDVSNIQAQNIPITARNTNLDQAAQQVAAQLSNTGKTVDLQNMTDAMAVVGRKLGLTGQALQQYLAQNFFGVQKLGQDFPLGITRGTGTGNGPGAQTYSPNFFDTAGATAGLPSQTGTATGTGPDAGAIDPQTRQAYFNAMGVYPESDPNLDRQFLAYLQTATQVSTPNAGPSYSYPSNSYVPGGGQGTQYNPMNQGYDYNPGSLDNYYA